MKNIWNIEAEQSGSLARTGFLSLSRGLVETPVFMPVGTNGAVKALHHDTLEDTGYSLILANTYHLYLRPGTELIKNAGGLHSFCSWKKNILTDSGGFQVFSLAPYRKIQPGGIRFRSHIDGAYHTLTPEDVVRVQSDFGVQIAMPLDVCTEPGISKKEAEQACVLTTSWAKKSLAVYKELYESQQWDGSLFGIIQGNFFPELRKQSTGDVLSLDLPGVAIGGLSVGEDPGLFYEFLGLTSEMLPAEKPHYLMGVGTPDYMLAAVDRGIDMFDCVLPTRIARNGTALTYNGQVVLKQARYEQDNKPIEEGCPCRACMRYTRAYTRHLFKARELLGPMLITEHNLTFMARFMESIRKSIRQGDFTRFKKEFLDNYNRAES